MRELEAFTGYIWNSKKKKFKYHIGNRVGTLCRLENGVGSFAKLDSCGDTPPPGRAICSICEAQKAKGSERFRRDEKRKANRKINAFYDSWEWKKVRYEAIKRYGRRCMCCGATSQIVVDHIKPVRRHPELSLDLSNLQILCDECNRGKSYHDETDWRPTA